VPPSIETTYCHVEAFTKGYVKNKIKRGKKTKTELWVMEKKKKTRLGEGRE